MSKVISFDTESYYDADYSLKTLGTARYCRDPLFDVYMISVSDGASSWAGHPENFNWECLDGATLLSHNAAHDRTVVAEMQKRGQAPLFKPENWYCTANLSAALCNRRDLERASEFLLGVRLVKDARDAAKGKHYADMERDGSAEKMLEYARSDALHCHQLWTTHSHRWSQFERDLSELTVRQSMRGVQIDTEKLNNYYKIVHAALAAMRDSLPWVKEGKAVLSSKAVSEECRRCKIPSPPIKSHEGGVEAFAEWYATYVGRSDLPWVRTYSDVRSIGILLDTLEKIRDRVDENGILTFGLLYFGSHTGRWSGSGGINFLNLRKAPYFFGDDGLPRAEESECEEIEACFVATGAYPEWVRYVVDIRSLIIPRPGRSLILSDLSAIEPRVAAWVTGDTALLDGVAAGYNIYESHCRATMGWKGGELQSENKKLYSLAKARLIGLSYGCGWEKFISMAMTLANFDVTEEDPEFTQDIDRFSGSPVFNADGTPKMVSGYGFTSKKTVREYREQNPKVTDMWKTLDSAFKASVGGDFTMTLPSGRKMIYRDVKQEWSRVYDDELKKYRNKRAVKAEIVKSGRIMRDALYGGSIFENLCQSVARDVLGENMLALDSASGIDVLFSCHDETINEVDDGVTPEDVTRLMTHTPSWIEGLPLASKTALVSHYTK